MSDSPDWQRPIDIVRQSVGNLDINISSQSLNQVAIDLAEASIGTLAVDVAAQSLGTLGIDIEAQSIGDLDILFSGQATGVADASQFAAEQGQTRTPTGSATVDPGNVSKLWDFTNNTGSDVFIEQFVGNRQDSYSDQALYIMRIDRDGDGIVEQTVAWNQVNMPATFDPGFDLPDGGFVSVDAKNLSSSQGTFGSTGFIREV